MIGEGGEAIIQYVPRCETGSKSGFIIDRFDSGNVDEITLAVPDIGTLQD